MAYVCNNLQEAIKYKQRSAILGLDSAELVLPEVLYMVAVRWQLDYCHYKAPLDWSKMVKSHGWQGLTVAWNLSWDVYQRIYF